MKKENHQQIIGSKSKCIMKKNTRGLILWATVTKSSSAMAKSNLLKQQESVDTSFINDEKRSFNVIIYSVTILVLMSFGVAGHVTKAMFKNLQ